MTNSRSNATTKVSLVRLAWTFFLTGLTAFGFTALQSLRSIIKKHGWLSDEKLDEGLALVQVYPGPINFDYAAYLGYQMRGVFGAVVSTLCFVFPSFTLMVALSHLYFSTGNPEWIPRVFMGLEAVVVGILINLILDFGAKSIRNFKTVIIAVLALTGLVVQINALWIVLASLSMGMLFLREKIFNPQAKINKANIFSQNRKEWILIGVVIICVLGLVLFVSAIAEPIRGMCLSFFKIGSIAFGNGMMILPLLRSELVDALKVLTPIEFTDGVVLGQITPGPFMITAAFVGYKLGGLFGAVLATFSIYSPSFTMTLIFSNIYNRIKDSIWIQAALAGIMAAFIGMLCLTTFQIAQVSITNFYAGILAAAAFVATRYLKLNVFWVFLGGLSLWLIILAFKLV